MFSRFSDTSNDDDGRITTARDNTVIISSGEESEATGEEDTNKDNTGKDTNDEDDEIFLARVWVDPKGV